MLRAGLGVLDQEALDPLQLLLAQAEIRRADYAVHLVRAPPADDGRGHGRVPQRPGDGDLGGGAPMLRSDLLQQPHQLQVAREPGLVELGGVAAPVVGGQVLHALWGHLAGEQAALHRRVDDDADVLFPAVGKYLIFYAAVYEVVRRLEGLDGCYLLRPLHLLDVEVRDPDVPGLALLFELRQSAPALLYVLLGVGPVDLVQVDDVGLQPPQTILALAFT